MNGKWKISLGLITLALLLTAFYFWSRNRAGPKDEAYQEMAPIAKAMKAFRSLNGRYPFAGMDLIVKDYKGAPFIKGEQLKDIWGTNYRFSLYANGDCELRSAGQDKIFDNVDDPYLLLTARPEKVFLEGRSEINVNL
jgi:hypothetical protein